MGRLVALLLSCLAAASLCGEARAREAVSFKAGFLTLEAGASRDVPVLVWYPTSADEGRLRREAYVLSVAPDATPAQGRFPVILISHDSFGGPLDHRELAAALARGGFVVAVPLHKGDAAGETKPHRTDLVFIGRAWQAVAALDAVLAEPRLAAAVDARRIGMAGLGTGGYTALLVAGGTPDFARWPLYCDQHMSDFELCGGSAYPAIRITRPGWRPPYDRRINALVLFAPLGLPFGRGSLDRVALPIRLYEAESDTVMLREPNAAAILSALARPPERAVIAGGHFIFVDPCPPLVAGMLRASCRDRDGIDRPAIHRRLEEEVRDFLERVL